MAKLGLDKSYVKIEGNIVEDPPPTPADGPKFLDICELENNTTLWLHKEEYNVVYEPLEVYLLYNVTSSIFTWANNIIISFVLPEFVTSYTPTTFGVSKINTVANNLFITGFHTIETCCDWPKFPPITSDDNVNVPLSWMFIRYV